MRTCTAMFSEFAGKLSSKLLRVGNQLWSIRLVRRRLSALPFCALGFVFIYSWTLQANSCALIAFLGLILFDIITLIGDLVSQFYAQPGKSTPSLSFGYVRVEILVHFTVLTLGLLINAWALKLCLELVFAGTAQVLHTGRFIPTLIIGTMIHFFACLQSNSYVILSKVSATCTYLQKCYQGICTSLGLSLSSSSAFAFSHNPFAILGVFSCCVITALVFLLPVSTAFDQSYSPRWMDFVGGISIILAFVNTLWPLSCYTGQILLQTVPAHTSSQLDKALREALTIDGVLEFRNEMFWTLSYGQVAGSLHVRVRRDANEQLILMQVYEKLVPLAPHLTIQVTKDEARHYGPLQVQEIMRGTPHMSATVINLENSSEMSASILSPDSTSQMSPIPSSFPHKHVIYSSASGSSTNSKPPRHNNYAINISTSTKINAEDTFGEINETALDVGDSSLLSSTTSSVFPLDPPTLLRPEYNDKYNPPTLSTQSQKVPRIASDTFGIATNTRPLHNPLFGNNAFGYESKQNVPVFKKEYQFDNESSNFKKPKTLY